MKGIHLITDNPYNSPERANGHPNTNLSRGCGCAVTALFTMGAVALFGFILFLPFGRGLSSRQYEQREREEEEWRQQQASQNQLRKIALALHSYHDDFSAFPPAKSTDATANRLHSWRTLIPPYLGEQELYDSIDLTKPWDDPVNAAAVTTNVEAYACSSQYSTTCFAVVGTSCCIHPNKPRPRSEITKDHSSTLMLISAPITAAVPWLSPQDADSMILLRNRKMNVAFVDGTTGTLDEQEVPDIRRAVLISVSLTRPQKPTRNQAER